MVGCNGCHVSMHVFAVLIKCLIACIITLKTNTKCMQSLTSLSLGKLEKIQRTSLVFKLTAQTFMGIFKHFTKVCSCVRNSSSDPY